MTDPWCWYIYQQNWVIKMGQMLGFIFQHHGSVMGVILIHNGFLRWK